MSLLRRTEGAVDFAEDLEDVSGSLKNARQSSASGSSSDSSSAAAAPLDF